MVFIIGGAFQGKLEYALEYSACRKEDSLDLKDQELGNKKVVYNLNLYIRRKLEEGLAVEDIKTDILKFIEDNKEVVIVSTELGYGVVPMDKFNRLYRESVGRICSEVAKKADKVIRIVCGLPSVIKDKGDRL